MVGNREGMVSGGAVELNLNHGCGAFITMTTNHTNNIINLNCKIKKIEKPYMYESKMSNMVHIEYTDCKCIHAHVHTAYTCSVIERSVMVGHSQHTLHVHLHVQYCAKKKILSKVAVAT